MSVITSLLAGFFAGMLGAMGLGGGGILVIYLTLFAEIEQIKAQGINLIFFVSIALVSVILLSFRRLVNLKFIFPAILFGIPGSIFGFYLSSKIDSLILGKIFGIFLLLIGIYQIFQKNKR